jgi:nucleoside phosphorylase
MGIDTYPVVLFALHRERMPFWRSFPVRRSLREAPCPAWLCSGPVTAVEIVHCGMGAANVERPLGWVLSRRPPAVILAGFSGSLVPTLPVGALIEATGVRTPSGASHAVTLPLRTSAVKGPILSVNRFILARTEKEELHAATGALAVDMESGVVAQRCAEVGIPFGCLRVISDGLEADLPPELDTVTDGERVRLLPLLKALWRRPGLLRDLWRLANATRTAAKNLAAGLHEALRSLPPEQRDAPAPSGR